MSTPGTHLGHVEIVHKDHRVLPHGGSVDALAAFVKLAVDDVLHVVWAWVNSLGYMVVIIKRLKRLKRLKAHQQCGPSLHGK